MYGINTFHLSGRTALTLFVSSLPFNHVKTLKLQITYLKARAPHRENVMAGSSETTTERAGI